MLRARVEPGSDTEAPRSGLPTSRQVAPDSPLLNRLQHPSDLAGLSFEKLQELAAEIRAFLVDAVARTGGHLGSNLGVVELTIALHRTFRSPEDVILWDTGHCAYVHKLLTGRRDGFETLRQAGGLSGYPARAESKHDWVENSHASTILSYADGLARAFGRRGTRRQVVGVIGDGALTGGMAYEALNNIGFHGRPVVVILNDNGRSYAPTVSRLTLGQSSQPGRAGGSVRARRFFEALGLAYVGPVDGHDLVALEDALHHARATGGPVVVHVATTKGKGYGPAVSDEEKKLHDCPTFVDIAAGPPAGRPSGYTGVFADALVELGRRLPELVAVTAAMPGSTGLLPFQAAFPDRFVDVGISEQHAVTAAAGMAMGGLRPVVAIYSTFLTRAIDQVNLDVALHGLPVTFVVDRAGITGNDGPSHNGVLDLALCLAVPGLTVLAPSSAQELLGMLDYAVRLDGPSVIRFPKGASRHVPADAVGQGTAARCVQRGDGSACLLAVGTMLEPVEKASRLLEEAGLRATVWDARAVKPLDEAMLADAPRHDVVVTVEDGLAVGGAGSAIAAALSRTGPMPPGPPVVSLGTPLRFLEQGQPDTIRAGLGLDATGIARSVAAACGLEDARFGRTS